MRCDLRIGPNIFLAIFSPREKSDSGPLHQRADNRLLRLAAAEIVAAGLGVGFVIEDRRMGGMGDEVRNILARRQLAAPGGRRIETNHDRSRLHARNNLGGDLTDQFVGNSENGDVSFGGGLTRRHRAQPSRLELRTQ